MLLLLVEFTLTTAFNRTGRSLLWMPIGGKQLLHNVTWLHVPKCGSTFNNILFRGACRATTKHPFIEPLTVAFIVTAPCPAAFKRFQSGHNPL